MSRTFWMALIMTCISCAITLNTASWWNVYFPLCNASWQPGNIWAMLPSSFLARAYSIPSSNPQQAQFCGEAKVLHVAPWQSKTNWGLDLCQVMPAHISFNITLPLRPLSLDWLLRCFCVKAFTFCFPNYFQK